MTTEREKQPRESAEEKRARGVRVGMGEKEDERDEGESRQGH